MKYLGYPCMNKTLRQRSPPIRCNRDMQRKTFEKKGLAYASELTLQNFTDLLKILKWNVRHGIYFYRCTSKLVPWHSEFELIDLPDFEAIKTKAEEIGSYINEHNIRLTFHPSHWVKLASENEETVANSVQSLVNHGEWMDLMGLNQTPFYAINIHIGAHYSDKVATAQRFREQVNSLPDSVRNRLVVENDDKESLWSVRELVQEVGIPCGIPITFDYHHHQFCDRGDTYKEAFDLAKQTWPNEIEPIVHYSEPACLYGTGQRPQAHANQVSHIPDWLQEDASVMVEAGGKEQAILPFITFERV